ncbi:MAG: hypothetical protein LBH20_01155 [Treponema sp.]|jgi:hypothetical protein|nr:hypothetical protein [Treponema sp.]
MVILWYGLVPVAGALVKRYKWHTFRKRFDELRLCPILDYSQYSQEGKETRLSHKADTFRFVGGFESVTDGQTLWIRSEDLTVPVSLQNAEIYLLPMQKGDGISEFDPGEETPEKIRWERVSALTEGARVFAGGLLVCQNGRRSFVSAKNKPLMVIFYDGPDQSLAARAIRAGRQRGEYWNSITPYSLIVGALCQILVAVAFLSRPAFRLTVIVSLIALFVPLYPMIPPGLLFTVMYRRLAWRSRILRAYRDLARLPLRYLSPQKNKFPWENLAPLVKSRFLPNGEQYGFTCTKELPSRAEDGTIPLLLPELTKDRKDGLWYIFGALHSGEELPVQPEDSFATFGILPGRPETIARRCEILAYTLELTAWVVLLAGIGLNIFFLRMILVLL